MKNLNEILLEKLQKNKRKQEKFLNLKQQDRIEFLLLKQDLEKNRVEVKPFNFIFLIMGLVGYLLLFGLVVHQYNENIILSMLELIYNLLRFGLIVFFILLLLDLYFINKFNEKYKQLIKRFLKE